MKKNSKENLRSIAKASLQTGMVYSVFEGIFYYRNFPIRTLLGIIELTIRNLFVFLSIGCMAFFLFSLLRKFYKDRSTDIMPFVLSSLVLFPVYFFLLARSEGTGLLYHFLKGPKQITLMLILPVLFLFYICYRSLSKDYAKKYIGLIFSTFFYINLGYLYVSWGSIFKVKLPGILSLLVVSVIIIMLYLTAIKVWGVIIRSIDGIRKSVEPWKALFVIGISFSVLLAGLSYLLLQEKKHPPNELPNVLLIVLDTARSDRFSCYGHWRDTTPFLKSFIENANLYREAITPSPWTMPSHASLFTGLFPSAHGLEWNNFSLDERFTTLPEYLAAKGYVTAGFCNNLLVIRENGLAQGFDYYVEMWNKDILNPVLYYRMDWFFRRLLGRNDGGALRTNQFVMDWLERSYSGEQPFFIFINLMECHLAYDAPDAYHEKFLRKDHSSKALGISRYDFTFFAGIDTMTAAEWQDYQDIYDGDLFYLDAKLEELFTFLEDESYLDNTVVIVTGDHGEFLGEHQLTGHTLSLYEPLLKVPLIIKVPDGRPALPEVRVPVQLVDIYPTLMEILGDDEEDPGYSIQGLSLMQYEKSPDVFTIAEFEPLKGKITGFLEQHPGATEILKFNRSLKAIRADSLKYIWSPGGEAEFYNLSSDPGELRNLIEDKPEQASVLEKELMDWSGSFEHAERSEEGRVISNEIRQRLKALGYID